MKKDKQKVFNIGISCIGSGVGQSIITSLNLSNLTIRTIGFGTNPFAYGAYDCSAYDYTPSIYAEDYIDKLIIKCIEHKIDLLIPGLDDEVLLYAENEDKFRSKGINAIFSKLKMVQICRDKELMSLDLNKIENVFVRSYDKRTLKEDISSGIVKFPFIAKPRGGFASRGVEIIKDETDLFRIKDEHIIQELAVPNDNDPNYNFFMGQIAKNINPQVAEISIQLVFGKKGNLMGKMMSYNKLNNGVPIEILPYDNEYVWGVIDRLIPIFLKMGLVGPINIQGRLTNHGLKLFEMNPRFTGITGLRALMGFNEVECCVKEWLGIDIGNNRLELNLNRFGTRQTSDRVVDLSRNERISNLKQKISTTENHFKPNLLITGASGYLGRNLILKLLDEDRFNLIVYTRDKKNFKSIFQYPKVAVYDQNDVDLGKLSFGNVDLIIHMASARPHHNNSQISESISFTNNLFTNALLNQVPAIINISSQAVYGLDNDPLWKENLAVAPSSPYAVAKYAAEDYLNSMKRLNKQLHCTSIRLGSVAGEANGFPVNDFLSKIVKKSMNNEIIQIYGGNQKLERIDIRDTVDAINLVLKSDSRYWKPVYNLSSGEVKPLIKIAEQCIRMTKNKLNGISPKLEVIPKEVNMNFGMDSSLFMGDFKWKPKYKFIDTIQSYIDYYEKQEK